MDSYLGAVPGAEDEERGLLLVVLIAFTYTFAFDCEALCVEQLFSNNHNHVHMLFLLSLLLLLSEHIHGQVHLSGHTRG